MSIFKSFDSFAPRKLCTKVVNLFDFLMMVPCGSKHVTICSVIVQYKYMRNSFVHFIGLLSWISSVIKLHFIARKLHDLKVLRFLILLLSKHPVVPFRTFTGMGLRRLRIVTKWVCYLRHVRLSILPSACINSSPTGRISRNLDTGDFRKNLTIK